MKTCSTKSCCCFAWLAGFFAPLFLVHLVRIIMGWNVMISNFVVPMKLSYIACAVAGILSIGLAIMGCKKCKKDCK